MIVSTSARMARAARAARLAVLTAFALFTAHDAIYVAQYGLDARYASAMAAGGHDGYYVPTSLLVSLAATLLAALAVRRLVRLDRLGASAPPTGRLGVAVVDADGPTYLGELRSVWVRLLPAVVVLYALQENVEALAMGHAAPGLGVLFGSTAGFVLPILGISTFLLAALGAAFRWRTKVLLRRTALRQAFARPAGRRLSERWAAACASIPHLWTLDRRDAGRAPPVPA